jgi:hypothetical protein
MGKLFLSRPLLSPMQLAILHYHLNPGGVARVVQNHLLALSAGDAAELPERVVLLHGGRADQWPHQQLARQLPFRLDTVTVPGLDYDGENAPELRGRSDRLVETIRQRLGDAGCAQETTLLHWHNHALGKNVAVPVAVAQLARSGYRMLLQIHDFAEDFRPDNYRSLHAALVPRVAPSLAEALYPQSSGIHYAVLNDRDRQVLARAGVARDRLHLLPNPVAEIGAMPAASMARKEARLALEIPAHARLITYPVRGIRRKNLGEMLLASAVATDAWFHVTIAPKNRLERASFDRWQAFAKGLDLPCRFGAPPGGAIPFELAMAASDMLMTCSVAEGFGMAFLECWLAGRPLVGRDLPEITSDFRAVGVDLGQLLTSVSIPADWVDQAAVASQIVQLARQSFGRYGLQAPEDSELLSRCGQLLQGSTLDFALLPRAQQREIIARVRRDTGLRQRLLQLNPGLEFSAARLTGPVVETLIESNARVVRRHYSLSTIGSHLASIYAQIGQAGPNTVLTGLSDGPSILSSFLRLDRLHAIRLQP